MQPQEWFQHKLQQFKDDPEFQTELLLLEINEQIVERMAARGIKRSELANRLGFSRAFVTRLLNGKPNLTVKTLVRVASALDLNVKVRLQPNIMDWQLVFSCEAEGNRPRYSQNRSVGVRDESAIAA